MLIYLLLGSNVGDKREHFSRAKELLEQHLGPIKKRSNIYETEAWGFKDQENFFNQALALETNRSPKEVLSITKQIEKEVGRVESEKWHPRVLDIDILMMGSLVLDTPDLKVPHPEMPSRNFALIPLLEIAGEIEHPVLKCSIEEVFWDCKDDLEVLRLDFKD